MTESERKKGDVLAVVVPCYNEEAVLHETTRRLTELLDRLRAQGDVDEGSFILYVNDGSQDNTWNIISELYQTNK